MIYIVPAVLIIIFLYGLIKKMPLFDTFADGVKEALRLVLAVAPYLIAIFALLEVLRASGLSAHIARLVAPVFGYLGIPAEIAELLVLRPLSGSGSLAVLETILATHGADSYIGRVASVAMASTDTVMYITAVYLGTSKDKKSGLAIPISLIASLIGAVVSALVCKII